MPLPQRAGARTASAILLTLVALAMSTVLVSWTTPASPHDVNNLARNATFRRSGAPAIRPVGQFTRALTKRGLPPLLFRDGLGEFWGTCGGTIAINPTSMSAVE